MLIESGEGGSGPDPSKDTVLMDAWVPPETRHDAPGSAEPFTFVPADTATTAVPADETAPVSPVAPQFSAASGSSAGSASGGTGVPAKSADLISATWEDPKAEFRAAATVHLPHEDYASATNGVPEIVLSAVEAGDDPHKTTVVGFTVDTQNAAASSPTAGDEVSAAETAGSSSAVATDDAPAGSPAAEHALVPESVSAVTSLYSEPTAGPQPSKKVSARTTVRAGISPTVFMIVVSYASAMTLVCIYLVFQLFSNPRTYDLPDLAPPKQKEKSVTSVIYVSPDQELPPANVLKLGESRQYGSLKVTPLRVTRGPLAFEYYEPEAEQEREPEGPVLKLHLRFENVSRDQEFIPLDSKLVFTKKIQPYGLSKANNFVCNVADRKKPAKLVFMFDLTPNGNWLLKGENLDRDFEPGEVFETFIPTTPEQIESLAGDLVWRVHFRKGYNRKSLRGVTTLIEVFFNNSDIVDEDEPAPAEHVPDVPAKERPAKKSPTVKDA